MKIAFQKMINLLSAPLDPKRFCGCVLTVVVSCLIGVAAFNWIINPYGQYCSDLLQPIVQDSRSEKVDLFERLASPPQGLILGSSRAMKFEPEYLQSRTGKTFFNFAVNHGRPEDFLAIVRYYRQGTKGFPKILIVGVDVASLTDAVPNDARLSAEPRLYSLAKDTSSWNDAFDQFSQLFSYQQLTSSIASIRNLILSKKSSVTEQFFSDDGVIQYVNRQSQMNAGTYDFESALDFNQDEFLLVFSQLNKISQRRLAYLRETVELCRENECQVYLFTTVSHPRLRESLASKTKFAQVEAQAIKAIRELANNAGAIYEDFGTVDQFDGDPNCFVDGIHPLEPNTRRMIDRLIPQSMVGKYAIQ